jgi:hypothetical protein
MYLAAFPKSWTYGVGYSLLNDEFFANVGHSTRQ